MSQPFQNVDARKPTSESRKTLLGRLADSILTATPGDADGTSSGDVNLNPWLKGRNNPHIILINKENNDKIVVSKTTPTECENETTYYRAI